VSGRGADGFKQYGGFQGLYEDENRFIKKSNKINRNLKRFAKWNVILISGWLTIAAVDFICNRIDSNVKSENGNLLSQMNNQHEKNNILLEVKEKEIDSLEMRISDLEKKEEKTAPEQNRPKVEVQKNDSVGQKTR
jgi:hypothetical protein